MYGSQGHRPRQSPGPCSLPACAGFPKDARGFKFGKIHHLGEIVDPDRVARHTTSLDEATLRRAVHKYFPGASGPLNHAAVCLYTNTPDEHFLVDQHPNHPQVGGLTRAGGGGRLCICLGMAHGGTGAPLPLDPSRPPPHPRSSSAPRARARASSLPA